MFSQLVVTFQSAALIQLGRVKNPQSDKMEKDLRRAQYSIDMLDMLDVKTRGNRSEEEDKMLKSALMNLKMSYVQELAKEKQYKDTDGGKENQAEPEKK